MPITQLPGPASLPSAPDLLPPLDASSLAPGTRVEVRSRFDAKWTRGFEVADLIDDQYRLRRVSDGAELPVLFAHGDVRIAPGLGRW